MQRVRFNEDTCKGCGLCVSVCPKGIIFLADRVNRLGHHPATVVAQDECISCTLCAVMCPDLVIEVFRPARDAAAGVAGGNGVAARGAGRGGTCGAGAGEGRVGAG